MPRGLEKAEKPQPPVPIRLRADNCTRPWGSHPNKLRRERGRGGTRQGQGHFSVIDRKQTNDIRQARLALWIVDTESYMGEDLQRADMIKTLFGANITSIPMLADREVEERVFQGESVRLSRAFHLAV